MIRVTHDNRKVNFTDGDVPDGEKHIGDILTPSEGECGFCTFWPVGNSGGAWPEYVLRAIADHMRPHDDAFNEYVALMDILGELAPDRTIERAAIKRRINELASRNWSRNGAE